MKNLRRLGAVCAMLFSVSQVNAAVVSFSIKTSVTQGGLPGPVFDYPATDFAIPVGTSIRLDPGSSNAYLDVVTTDGGTFSVIDSATTSVNSYLELFAHGDTIGASSFNVSPGGNGWGYALYDNVAGPDWVTSFTGQYIGFQTGAGNYGYVNVNWTYNASTGIGTLDFLNGAVETVANTAITIGSVPIPAAAWLFGSGLLGLVGMGRCKKAV